MRIDERYLWVTASAVLALATSEVAWAGFVQEAQFGAGTTLNLSWGDADGDGDFDCAVANLGGGALYRNDGTGSFSLLTVLTGSNCLALCYGDFDNDGDQDIAQGRIGQNGLFVNDGTGVFVRHTPFGNGRANGMAWSDVDLDGDLDMAVARGLLGSNQQSSIYLNNGDGTFTATNLSTPAQWAAFAFGDCDGDGDADLAVARGGFCCQAPNLLLINDGAGHFTEREEFGGFDTTSIDWGDADNDGDLDVVVGNWESGPNRLYLNDGLGNFTGGPELGVRDCNTITWGDVDEDGDLDLAVGNWDFSEADSNFVYLNDGLGAFSEQYEFGLGSTDGVAFADADGDGDQDVAIGNEHTPPTNYLYRNDSGSSALRVHLVGHRHDLGLGYSNRDGIGARITAYAAGHVGDPAFRLGMREIQAQAGFSCQDAIDAHFALPDDPLVDLVIRWPGSGGSQITQVLEGVARGQRLLIHESPAAAAAPEGAFAASARVTPNPAFQDVTVVLARIATDSTPVAVLDAAGRIVRRFSIPAGSTTGRWDRRDEHGRELAAGVYFVRVGEPGGDGSATRVVTLR